MSVNTAPQRPMAAVGETNNFAVSVAGSLDTDESVTGTPTIAEQTTSDLTISNVAVSSSVLTINGESVAVGAAIQFKVLGQLEAKSAYLLKITFTTSSSPAQTKVKYIKFRVATE